MGRIKLYTHAGVLILALAIVFMLSFQRVGAQELNAFTQQQLSILDDKDILNDQQAIDSLVQKGPAVLDFLLGQLENAARDKKAALIETIGKIADPRGFEPLKNELERVQFVRQKAETFADSYIRIMLIKALGDLGDKRAVPLLLKSKDSHDPIERTQALVALEKLDYQNTASELEVMAFGPESNCRNIVVMGLGRAGNTKAVPLLLKALNDEAWFVRASAVDALVKIADMSVIDHLNRMRNDRSPYVRQAAEEGIKTLEQHK